MAKESGKVGRDVPVKPAALTTLQSIAITGTMRGCFKLVFFPGNSYLGSDYSSIILPLSSTGHPRIEGHEDLVLDGTKGIYISERLAIILSESDTLSAIIFSFLRDGQASGSAAG